MKFNIKISRFGSYFFFLSNLAEWHFSCRRKYNEAWKKSIPVLSKKVKHLRQFGEILKKYEKWDGVANFPASAEATTRGNLKSTTEKMSAKERKIIEQSFILFKPEFEKIWIKTSPRLKKFSGLFRKRKNQNLIKKGEKILENYFGKPSSKKLDVYLLIAPAIEKGGGGANIGPNRITVEVGDMSSAGIKWILRIILHEVSHILYQNKFNKLIHKFTKSIPKQKYKKFKIIKSFGNVIDTVLKESITSSIIATGIIDEIVFNFPLQKQLKEDIKFLNWNKSPASALLRKSAALYLNKINKEYLRKKKRIDMIYLKQAWKFLEKFEEKYKTGKFKEFLTTKK